jgi:hypothetical protein
MSSHLWVAFLFRRRFARMVLHRMVTTMESAMQPDWGNYMPLVLLIIAGQHRTVHADTARSLSIRRQEHLQSRLGELSIDLPEPVLRAIFQQLSSKDLSRVNCVNKSQHEFTNDPSLWRNISYGGLTELGLCDGLQLRLSVLNKSLHVPGILQDQRYQLKYMYSYAKVAQLSKEQCPNLTSLSTLSAPCNECMQPDCGIPDVHNYHFTLTLH